MERIYSRSVHTCPEHQWLREVLHCTNSDAKVGSEPILCICISFIINTMLELMLMQTQTLHVNKASDPLCAFAFATLTLTSTSSFALHQ